MLTGRPVVRISGESARALAVAVAIVSIVAATAVADAVPGPAAELRGSGGSRMGAAATGIASAFTVSGTVGGLYPGRSTQLRLAVTNREPFRIVVTAITTTISDASPTCPAANLTVGAFDGRLRVDVDRTVLVPVPVAMRAAAPDACQGATFALRYAGTAVKG